MSLQERTPEARRAYIQGYKAGLENAAKRLEAADEETPRAFIAEAIRAMKESLDDNTPA